MPRHQETLTKVLGGHSDANIRFRDLRQLLKALGFEERIKGSHHTFRRADVRARINIQRAGGHAKPYQVRQVRRILEEYDIGGI